jgi:S-adenosylmethionine hydrolase
MVARLLQQAPDQQVINLFSDLTPFDVQAAAYLLPSYSTGFSPGTVFLCVVDPGVGSERPAVILQADDCWYVGPNEGLFALVARRAGRVECQVLPPARCVSSSFHGRDVFAPVAARLATGQAVDAQPVPTGEVEQPGWPDDLFRVVYVDRYGNAVTGIRAGQLDVSRVIHVRGHALHAKRTFSDVPAGTPFWYENSSGLIELAVNRGRADEQLGAVVGVTISAT